MGAKPARITTTKGRTSATPASNTLAECETTHSLKPLTEGACSRHDSGTGTIPQ